MAYLVAVTAYISSTTRTYMTVERLEKSCRLEKWGASVKTRGTPGMESRLTNGGIHRADVALLTTDIELVSAKRFEHCCYV